MAGGGPHLGAHAGHPPLAEAHHGDDVQRGGSPPELDIFVRVFKIDTGVENQHDSRTFSLQLSGEV